MRSWLFFSLLLVATVASVAGAGEPDRQTDGSRRPAPPGAIAADSARLPAPVLLSVELLPDPDSTPRAAPPPSNDGAGTHRREHQQAPVRQ
jgi:hypothetical protein